MGVRPELVLGKAGGPLTSYLIPKRGAGAPITIQVPLTFWCLTLSISSFPPPLTHSLIQHTFIEPFHMLFPG